MSKETETIKAVALVAEQAYREVFHVDDTATTTELNVLADAVAALDKPTPAPEPPAPNPDPPGYTCACGHRMSEHDSVGACMRVTCICCHYPDGELAKPDPTIRPEASQPNALPAEVERAIACFLADSDPVKVDKTALDMLKYRLSTLWPKAGQPSPVTAEPATREEAEKVVRAAAGRRPDFPSGKDYVDYVRGHDVSPSPVTAEKLVEQIRTIPNPWSGDVDLFQNIRLATRQGFEECREAVLKLVRSQGLVQPVLTREQVATVFENEFPGYSQGYRSRVVDDILALSSRTVSKEQIKKIAETIQERHVTTIINKNWLQEVIRQTAELLGIEVAE